MRMLTRTVLLAAIAGLGTAGTLSAQLGANQFRWFVGANGGALVFETRSQTRGAIPMAGGNLLITAKRTALMISVEEGIGSNEHTSIIDLTANNSERDVTFNDLRRYSAVLMVYPLKSAIQPFLGLGYGLMYIHNPQPAGPFADPVERYNATQAVRNAGSTGYGTFVGGLQLQAGPVAVYGQYQITTSPPDTHLLVGPTHAFTGGLRVSLGGAKEGITSNTH